MRLNRTYVVAVALALVGAGTVAPMAFGSPSSGFTGIPLVTADFDDTVRLNNDGIKFQTKDRTDVMVQKIVIEAGGTSGWHHHPGIVILAVESGSVTLWNSHCRRTTYGPGHPNGAVFTESGDKPAQVTSARGSTVYATFVTPNRDPFRIEDNPPWCAKKR